MSRGMTDFDVILDQCLTDVAAGLETIDSCLRRYPALANQLAPLLAVAEQVRAVPAASTVPRSSYRLSRLLSDLSGAAGSG